MKKTNQTFKGVPVYTDPEVPLGQILLTGSMINSQPRRNGVLKSVSQLPISDATAQLVKVRQNWWKFWLPKSLWIVNDKGFLRLYNPKLDPKVGSAGFADLNYKGESLPNHGRVVKATERPEYTPENNVKGGKVVRVMPKQLRKIKEGQENGHS